MMTDTENCLNLYFNMLLIRSFEELIITHYPEQEMKTPVHLCIGQEAIAAGICCQLGKEDTIFSTHRNHGHCLAKGMDPQSLLSEFYGKACGCAGGKGGSMHPVDRNIGILGTTAIVGGGIPIAVGTAWAQQMQKKEDVTVVFFGDGASEEGTFHESLNFASLKNIPVVFVCENNMYATASPLRQRQPELASIAAKASTYDMPGTQIDGNDVLAVYRAGEEAIKRARQGHGPTLIEAVTYRWKGHVGPNDDTLTGHRPEKELLEWIKRCPVNNFKEKLTRSRQLTPELAENYQSRINTILEQALTAARSAVPPEGDALLKNVFSES